MIARHVEEENCAVMPIYTLQKERHIGYIRVIPRKRACWRKQQQELRHQIFSHFCTIRGAIIYDGVKIEEAGKKYYDFILHFMEVGREDRSIPNHQSASHAPSFRFDALPIN